jgi:hypothetical protein
MVDVIIPLKIITKIFKVVHNPEYGKMLFGTKFYVNSYPEYDNWSSDMELDMAYAGIYGKLSDLSLFSQTNCFDNKAVGIIKIHEFIWYIFLLGLRCQKIIILDLTKLRINVQKFFS